jgi:hypothetical protein
MRGADLEAFTPVAQAFETMGVPYHIGGSVASSTHGVARTTLDIDVVADLPAERIDAFVDLLEDRYYVDPEAARDAVRRRSSFNLIHLETMYKIDVFVQRRRPFDLEAARRTVRVHVFGDDEPMFPVSSAEDTILAKLDWFLVGRESSQRQWSDIVGLLRTQSLALDTAYVRRWAEELRVADLLDRAIRDAEGDR